MARKDQAKRAAKRHAKALKRQKKQAERKARSRVEDLMPAPAPRRRAVVQDRLQPRGVAWDPGLPHVGNRLRRPPEVKKLPAEGPDLVAVPFDDELIAIYRRGPGRRAELLPWAELPVDHEVGWLGRPIPLREADVESVTWGREPQVEAGVVRGGLVVHALVGGEAGTTWAPRVPVEAVAEGGLRRVVVAGVARGILLEEGVQWEWHTERTHAKAVMGFLSSQAPLLWRMLDGGRGIDGAWRVRALRGFTPHYRRWAVEDVVAHADETIPHLIGILDEPLEQGPQGGDPDDWGPLYALSLLAHIGAAEAHPVLLTLARLPANDFETVFGAYLTEQLDAALLRTARGDLSGIRELLQDRAADGFLRAQAADALCMAVWLGQADRDEVLALLASQLVPDAAADPDSFVWSGVGSALLDLRAVAFEAQLVEACEAELVDPMQFDAEYVRKRLREDEADTTPHGLKLARTDNVHDWLGSWACFNF